MLRPNASTTAMVISILPQKHVDLLRITVKLQPTTRIAF